MMSYIYRPSRAYTYLKCSTLARLETGVTTHKLIDQEVLGMLDVVRLLQYPAVAQLLAPLGGPMRLFEEKDNPHFYVLQLRQVSLIPKLRKL